MPFGAELEFVIVTHELQRRGHLLVRQRPVAVQVVEVFGAVLQENANRFLFRFPNQRRVDIAAANVGEAADVTEHFAKFIGPLPRYGPRADAAGTDPANRAAVRVLCQAIFLPHLRQDFFEQKTGVLVAERIVLEAAIAARFLARLRRGNLAGIDKEADGHGHFLLRDEIVEHNRRAELTVGVRVIAAVLKDHHARRFGRLVLLRHVNPVITFRARKNLAAPMVFGDFAARHVFLRKRVRAELVVVGGEQIVNQERSKK